MLNDNNRDDMKKSIFMIDPSIAKTNQQESTIHENYSENYGLSALGIRASSVRRNLSPTVLIEKAIRNGEGILTDTGALAVTTGKFTGRSPHDKYIVDTDGVHDVINWGEVNPRPGTLDYKYYMYNADMLRSSRKTDRGRTPQIRRTGLHIARSSRIQGQRQTLRHQLGSGYND